MYSLILSQTPLHNSNVLKWYKTSKIHTSIEFTIRIQKHVFDNLEDLYHTNDLLELGQDLLELLNSLYIYYLPEPKILIRILQEFYGTSCLFVVLSRVREFYS